MTTTAVYTAQVSYSGDEVQSSNVLQKQNTNSNAVTSGAAYTSLSSGNNTITVPTGFTVNGVMIIPGSGNTTALIFKGVAGDTGVRLHNTVASCIPLDSSVASFVLNAASGMTVRLAWF